MALSVGSASLRTQCQFRPRMSSCDGAKNTMHKLSLRSSNGNEGATGHFMSNGKGHAPWPSQAEMSVLQFAQSHFAAQTLIALMRIGVLDVLAGSLTVDEIITELNRDSERKVTTTINRDALFRCLRLICTTGVLEEATKNVDGGGDESAFSLTEMGQLIRRPKSSDESSMASFMFHWAELPIWDSWSQLPDYVAGERSPGGAPSQSAFDLATPPFDRANGMSASEYYKENPDSCTHRNAVARYASSKEIDSLLDAMQQSLVLNESNLGGKTIVDIGGGYGDLMHEVKTSMPYVGKCYCLDLPDVIDDALSSTTDKDEGGEVALVSGDMFDSSTIPPCDVIFTKHVLCDFPDDEVVLALQSFRQALQEGGRVVIMDAVLPNGDDLNGRWNPAVSFDVLLMLTGRRGERSRLEWSNLAERAGFVLEQVLRTASVTVDLAVLTLA
ncbi:hypothetical protein ACHAWF_002617 [Thalassiosira exigua]